MVRKTVFLGVMIALGVILLSAMTLPAQDKMFTRPGHYLTLFQKAIERLLFVIMSGAKNLSS